ncbi:MAG: isoprenylcysteine carboxylmethyltransferase family protein [Rhodobacter sp.]|nr:isoprenylcysteine carboxylmethyltransferase family protein [Rhodobacter sp.]
MRRCAALSEMRGQPPRHRLLRQRESPPTWLLLFLGLAGVQARRLPLADAVRPGRIAGAVPGLPALAVFTLALPEFRRHRTMVLPRERPAAMIDTGICRLSRSPVCLADSMVLAGAALWWDTASLLLVPVFVRVITQRFILGEGAGLRAVFGAAFDRYAAQTRRWL